MLDGLRIVEALAGATLVAAVLSDVFRSVILPRATRRTLRLGPVLGIVLQRVWLAWARWKPRKRHEILGAFGPLLIVLELLIWVALMVAGYALLLHATDGLQPHASLVDALYAASSAFVTTGLSGQEAATGPARTVIVLAGLSGLTIVTLVVTFLISVQSALLRREALVLRLRARVGSGPSGVAVLATLARVPRETALTEFFEEWEAWAADVLLTHRAFPILVYFRSTDEDCGWLAALGAVLDASALMAVLGHERAGEQAAICHSLGARLIADLARQFSLQAPFAPGLDRAAFFDALERLAPLGYRTDRDRELLWPEFQDLRSQHQPPLRAITERFGEGMSTW